MKFFYSPGTSSLLPHIALSESGLAFEAIRVDEHTKVTDKGGDFRTINPLGYVPALQLDDDTILTEAVAIVQFIADKVPVKRLAPPNGTLDRAKLQSWLNFFSAEVHVGCFCPLFHTEIPQVVKTIFRERLGSRLVHVEHHLAQAEYLMGKDFSVADASSSSCRIGHGRRM
jgi:glutathione S-transferase